MVRAKKGVSPDHRLEELLKSPVFAGTGRTPVNLCRQKITVIEGDASLERLGLSDEIWSKMVNEVNVIINSAASVRFDDPMVKALAINTKSVITCLDLCRQLKNLASFVQVSTCYVNSHLVTSDEKIHPTKVTAEHLFEMAKYLPSDKLDQLCRDQLFEGRSNSYVFTKALAEDYLARHAKSLPISIVRLSIVTAAFREPEIGFVDVNQAASFLVMTQSLGALRTFKYNPDQRPQVVAVDTAANAVLVVAHQTSMVEVDKVAPPMVYNVTSTQGDMDKFFNVITKMAHKYPSINAVRYPIDLSTPPSTFSYHYNRWITEWLYVVIIQFIIRMLGFKQ